MIKFRKRPIEVEAMQFTGGNAEEIAKWAQGDWGISMRPDGKHIWIKQKVFDEDPLLALWFLVSPTLEGDMEAAAGDWIIRGIENEIYPCKSSVFEATYDRVADELNDRDQAMREDEEIEAEFHRVIK